jgi:lipopolysaccharide transport system permease protein
MGLFSDLQELVRYRELLLSWVQRDIKVRYKQSALGIAWAMLQPLAATILFAVIFSRFVRVPTEGIPYPIFYYSALLPWTFFSSSVSFAVPSLVNNMNLVTKIYFPREILPISSVVASFVDFLIASVVFIGMMIFYRVPVGFSIVLVPLVVAIQVLLTLGIVLLASALMIFYRDIRFVIPLGLQLWMYLTPIIYPVSLVPERFRPIYMLNPMAGIIDSYRTIILSAKFPQTEYLLLACAVSVVLFLGSYRYFKNAEMEFADII